MALKMCRGAFRAVWDSGRPVKGAVEQKQNEKQKD
jgi:hypothetical protein